MTGNPGKPSERVTLSPTAFVARADHDRRRPCRLFLYTPGKQPGLNQEPGRVSSVAALIVRGASLDTFLQFGHLREARAFSGLRLKPRPWPDDMRGRR